MAACAHHRLCTCAIVGVFVRSEGFNGFKPSIISIDRRLWEGWRARQWRDFSCFGLFFVFLRPLRVIRIILSPRGKRNKGGRGRVVVSTVWVLRVSRYCWIVVFFFVKFFFFFFPNLNQLSNLTHDTRYL